MWGLLRALRQLGGPQILKTQTPLSSAQDWVQGSLLNRWTLPIFNSELQVETGLQRKSSYTIYSSLLPSVLLRETQWQDRRLVATGGNNPPQCTFCLAHTDKNPSILGIPSLCGGSRGCSSVQMEEGKIERLLGTDLQYTAFEKMPRENQLFFHAGAWICLSAAQTQNESWKCVPRHQKANPRGLAVCLWNTSRLDVQRGL